MEQAHEVVQVEIVDGPFAGRTGHLIAADLMQATVALDDRWVQVPLENLHRTAALARWASRNQPAL